MRPRRLRFIRVVLSGVVVAGGCTSAVPEAPSTDAGMTGEASADAGTDSAADATTADTSDAPATDAPSDTPLDNGADVIADVGPPLDATEPDGAGSLVACVYQSKHSGLPACAACVLPAEETINKDKIGVVLAPPGTICTSDAGTGIRSIAMPGIASLVKKIQSDLESQYMLGGVPPSETYTSQDAPGCGPIANGTFTGKITIENKLVTVNLDYKREPTIAGCAMPNGCVVNTLLCTGTLTLP